LRKCYLRIHTSDASQYKWALGQNAFGKMEMHFSFDKMEMHFSSDASQYNIIWQNGKMEIQYYFSFDRKCFTI